MKYPTLPYVILGCLPFLGVFNHLSAQVSYDCSSIIPIEEEIVICVEEDSLERIDTNIIRSQVMACDSIIQITRYVHNSLDFIAGNIKTVICENETMLIGADIEGDYYLWVDLNTGDTLGFTRTIKVPPGKYRVFILRTSTCKTIVQTNFLDHYSTPSYIISNINCSPLEQKYSVTLELATDDELTTSVGNVERIGDIAMIREIPYNTSLEFNLASPKGCIAMCTIPPPDCLPPNLPAPNIQNAKYCSEKEPVSIAAIPIADSLTIDWYTEAEGGRLLDSGTTHFLPNQAGVYYAATRHIRTGYTSPERVAVQLEQYERPKLFLADMKPSHCNTAVEEGLLIVGGCTGCDFTWNNGREGRRNDKLPFGSHTVTAIYEDACEITATFEVEYNPEVCEIFYIPNIFAPNGEELNDTFRAYFSENFNTNGTQTMVLRVEDQLGRLIFETRDPENGWDGNFLGLPLSQNTFVYNLELTRPNGRVKVYYGTFMLMR